MMDEEATRYGAVENAEEGRVYAAFLARNRSRYDGVILVCRISSTKMGRGLENTNMPIFLHAYPDDIGKLSPRTGATRFAERFPSWMFFASRVFVSPP